MPEPRVPRFAAVPVQFDTVNRTREQATAYQIARRRGGRRPSGRPVTVRNGLPDFKPYVYGGAGHDIMECTCHA